MNKFIDYSNFKEDDSLKRYAIKIAVNERIYSKLKKNGASRSFQYLMLKYFNASYVEKAYEHYSQRDFVIDEVDDEEAYDYRYVTVSGYFVKADFNNFEQIVQDYKFAIKANKINFLAKLVLYYLFDTGVIGCGSEQKINDAVHAYDLVENGKGTYDLFINGKKSTSTTNKRKQKTKPAAKKKSSSPKEKATTEINISIKINNGGNLK